jgi:hypothetical protein
VTAKAHPFAALGAGTRSVTAGVDAASDSDGDSMPELVAIGGVDSDGDSMPELEEIGDVYEGIFEWRCEGCAVSNAPSADRCYGCAARKSDGHTYSLSGDDVLPTLSEMLYNPEDGATRGDGAGGSGDVNYGSSGDEDDAAWRIVPTVRERGGWRSLHLRARRIGVGPHYSSDPSPFHEEEEDSWDGGSHGSDGGHAPGWDNSDEEEEVAALDHATSAAWGVSFATADADGADDWCVDGLIAAAGDEEESRRALTGTFITTTTAAALGMAPGSPRSASGDDGGDGAEVSIGINLTHGSGPEDHANYGQAVMKTFLSQCSEGDAMARAEAATTAVSHVETDVTADMAALSVGSLHLDESHVRAIGDWGAGQRRAKTCEPRIEDGAAVFAEVPASPAEVLWGNANQVTTTVGADGASSADVTIFTADLSGGLASQLMNATEAVAATAPRPAPIEVESAVASGADAGPTHDEGAGGTGSGSGALVKAGTAAGGISVEPPKLCVSSATYTSVAQASGVQVEFSLEPATNGTVYQVVWMQVCCAGTKLVYEYTEAWASSTQGAKVRNRARPVPALELGGVDTFLVPAACRREEWGMITFKTTAWFEFGAVDRHLQRGTDQPLWGFLKGAIGTRTPPRDAQRIQRTVMLAWERNHGLRWYDLGNDDTVLLREATSAIPKAGGKGGKRRSDEMSGARPEGAGAKRKAAEANPQDMGGPTPSSTDGVPSVTQGWYIEYQGLFPDGDLRNEPSRAFLRGEFVCAFIGDPKGGDGPYMAVVVDHSIEFGYGVVFYDGITSFGIAEGWVYPLKPYNEAKGDVRMSWESLVMALTIMTKRPLQAHELRKAIGTFHWDALPGGRDTEWAGFYQVLAKQGVTGDAPGWTHELEWFETRRLGASQSPCTPGSGGKDEGKPDPAVEPHRSHLKRDACAGGGSAAGNHGNERKRGAAEGSEGSSGSKDMAMAETEPLPEAALQIARATPSADRTAVESHCKRPIRFSPLSEAESDEHALLCSLSDADVDESRQTMVVLILELLMEHVGKLSIMRPDLLAHVVAAVRDGVIGRDSVFRSMAMHMENAIFCKAVTLAEFNDRSTLTKRLRAQLRTYYPLALNIGTPAYASELKAERRQRLTLELQEAAAPTFEVVEGSTTALVSRTTAHRVPLLERASDLGSSARSRQAKALRLVHELRTRVAIVATREDSDLLTRELWKTHCMYRVRLEQDCRLIVTEAFPPCLIEVLGPCRYACCTGFCDSAASATARLVPGFPGYCELTQADSMAALAMDRLVLVDSAERAQLTAGTIERPMEERRFPIPSYMSRQAQGIRLADWADRVVQAGEQGAHSSFRGWVKAWLDKCELACLSYEMLWREVSDGPGVTGNESLLRSKQRMVVELWKQECQSLWPKVSFQSWYLRDMDSVQLELAYHTRGLPALLCQSIHFDAERNSMVFSLVPDMGSSCADELELQPPKVSPKGVLWQTLPPLRLPKVQSGSSTSLPGSSIEGGMGSLADSEAHRILSQMASDTECQPTRGPSAQTRKALRLCTPPATTTSKHAALFNQDDRVLALREFLHRTYPERLRLEFRLLQLGDAQWGVSFLLALHDGVIADRVVSLSGGLNGRDPVEAVGALAALLHARLESATGGGAAAAPGVIGSSVHPKTLLLNLCHELVHGGVDPTFEFIASDGEGAERKGKLSAKVTIDGRDARRGSTVICCQGGYFDHQEAAERSAALLALRLLPEIAGGWCERQVQCSACLTPLARHSDCHASKGMHGVAIPAPAADLAWRPFKRPAPFGDNGEEGWILGHYACRCCSEVVGLRIHPHDEGRDEVLLQDSSVLELPPRNSLLGPSQHIARLARAQSIQSGLTCRLEEKVAHERTGWLRILGKRSLLACKDWAAFCYLDTESHIDACHLLTRRGQEQLVLLLLLEEPKRGVALRHLVKLLCYALDGDHLLVGKVQLPTAAGEEAWFIGAIDGTVSADRVRQDNMLEGFAPTMLEGQVHSFRTALRNLCERERTLGVEIFITGRVGNGECARTLEPPHEGMGVLLGDRVSLCRIDHRRNEAMSAIAAYCIARYQASGDQICGDIGWMRQHRAAVVIQRRALAKQHRVASRATTGRGRRREAATLTKMGRLEAENKLLRGVPATQGAQQRERGRRMEGGQFGLRVRSESPTSVAELITKLSPPAPPARTTAEKSGRSRPTEVASALMGLASLGRAHKRVAVSGPAQGVSGQCYGEMQIIFALQRMGGWMSSGHRNGSGMVGSTAVMRRMKSEWERGSQALVLSIQYDKELRISNKRQMQEVMDEVAYIHSSLAEEAVICVMVRVDTWDINGSAMCHRAVLFVGAEVAWHHDPISWVHNDYTRCQATELRPLMETLLRPMRVELLFTGGEADVARQPRAVLVR